MSLSKQSADAARADDAGDRPATGAGAAAGKKRSPWKANDTNALRGAPSGELRVRIIDSTADFAALHGRWSELLARVSNANVFISHEWLHAWWTSYAPDANLQIVVVDDGTRIVGLAPMMLERRRRAGVGCRTLRFIGDGTSETDHIDFVIADGWHAEVLPRLLNALARLPWDVAELNQLPEHSPTLQALLRWIDRFGWRRVTTLSPCPICRLPTHFDALLAQLPSRLRTSVRSARRRLDAQHRVEFGLHANAAELDAALSALFANHASRWQRKGQPGVFVDPKKRAFYARLTPLLLARGWLRFFYLKLDGCIVAQQFCFALDGTVMLLQEGFDSAHERDNVGNVLRARVFEHLIETGAHCYDFLAGTSRHKASWSNGAVTDVRLSFARSTWRGWLFFRVPQAWQRTKDRLRPLRDKVRDRLRGRVPSDQAARQ